MHVTLVQHHVLDRFVQEAYRRVGLSEADAKMASTALVTTDAWGVFTHGTKSLTPYLRRLQRGGLRAQGRPRVVSEGGAWVTVDGDAALGLVTSTFAMHQAMAKARLEGVGLCTVRNSCHFGAAGYYAWLAAREGLIGLSMANDVPTVAAPGSRGPVTGSNPFSYAVPAGRYPPLLLDMSIATVALGKVFAARDKGEPIPANWIVDGNGQPTTDASGLPGRGALMPAAGHKGYGLALLIETLAGLLSGAGFTSRVGSWLWDDGTKPTHHGAAFIAIDINAFMPSAEFLKRVETLIEEIHTAPRADGVDRLYMPGEMEWERYERALKQGIPLPDDVLGALRTAAELVGLDPPSEALA